MKNDQDKKTYPPGYFTEPCRKWPHPGLGVARLTDPEDDLCVLPIRVKEKLIDSQRNKDTNANA